MSFSSSWAVTNPRCLSGRLIEGSFGMAPTTLTPAKPSIDSRSFFSCLLLPTLFRTTPRIFKDLSKPLNPLTIAAAVLAVLPTSTTSMTGAFKIFATSAVLPFSEMLSWLSKRPITPSTTAMLDPQDPS